MCRMHNSGKYGGLSKLTVLQYWSQKSKQNEKLSKPNQTKLPKHDSGEVKTVKTSKSDNPRLRNRRQRPLEKTIMHSAPNMNAMIPQAKVLNRNSVRKLPPKYVKKPTSLTSPLKEITSTDDGQSTDIREQRYKTFLLTSNRSIFSSN